jgi:hypothetical protein
MFRLRSSIHGGVSAADHWACVGGFDLLIREAERLKERLEDLRESNPQREVWQPLALDAIPDTPTTARDKKVLEFRTFYRGHLENVKEMWMFESIVTHVGFPTTAQSLNVLRALDDHLDALRTHRSKNLGQAWSSAQIDIRFLASE